VTCWNLAFHLNLKHSSIIRRIPNFPGCSNVFFISWHNNFVLEIISRLSIGRESICRFVTVWNAIFAENKNGPLCDVNSASLFFWTTCNIAKFSSQISLSSCYDRRLCDFLNISVLVKWLDYRRRLPKEAVEIWFSKQAQTKWRKFFALGTMKMTKWSTLYGLQRPTVKIFSRLLHEILMVRRPWRNIRHHLYEWRKLSASLSVSSAWWAEFLTHVSTEPKMFIGMFCYNVRDFLCRCSPHWAQTICCYYNDNRPRDRLVNKSKKGNRTSSSCVF